MSFGENLERLDGILRRLESDPMPLDEALSAFEEGVKLVRESEALLRDTEQKVTFLTEGGPTGGDPADRPAPAQKPARKHEPELLFVPVPDDA